MNVHQAREDVELERSLVVCTHAYRPPVDPDRRGGDIFDLVDRPDGTQTILLGDAVAWGRDGVRHAEFLRHVFLTAAARTSMPDKILTAMNRCYHRLIVGEPPSHHFASLFVATFAPEEGRLTYASAGAPAAMLMRGTHKHEHLDPTGTIAGLGEMGKFARRDLRVGPGDMLVAFTDGITEARPRDNPATSIGTAGLSSALHTYRSNAPVITAEGLVKHVVATRAPIFLDDATLCVVEVG